jgi:hypothetical protein
MVESHEDTLRELDDAVTEVREFIQSRIGVRTGNNVSTMNVNAGGFGVWICTSICMCQFAILLAGGFLYLEHSRKIDRMQDYLNSIYLQAPQLKPKE